MINLTIRAIRLIIIILITFAAIDTDAQIYFQYEQANTLKVRKYQAGDIITFRLKQFGKEWISDDILQLVPEDNTVVFYDQIVQLDEFTHFQYERPWANTVGTSLMTFGGSWLIFGGAIEGLRRIDAIDTNYEFGTDTAIIGLSTILTGYLTRKLWSRAQKKMNKRNRVRIIDVRF